MELAIRYTNKKHQVIDTIVNSFPSVSVFWKSVASFIREAAANTKIYASSKDNGSATIAVKKQGGTEAIFTEVADMTCGLADSPFSGRYLVKGDKAYALVPVTGEDGDQYFTAAYGKSDEILSGKGKHVRTPYPAYLFWVKYYEKIAKGYKDRSRYIKTSAKTVADNETGSELFADLLADTKKALPLSSLARKARNIEKITLSETQIAKAWKVLRQLKRAKRLKTFQTIYLSLLSLLPKTGLPETATASDMENDRFMERIASTLSDLENIVACKSSFADCGVTISRATADDETRIRAMLPDHIASRVEAVYAVSNPAKEASFKAWIDRHNITATKELWHGSRNENWISIIKNGLRIHPNAAITGKMFGDGIYFAPEAKKSYNYTSCQGTYWANGASDYGFMGLFTTAYGNPCHDTNRFNGYYRRTNSPQKTLNRKGFDCLHALASKTSLLHDEIVFYHEDAVRLSYLVKIRS